MANAPTGHAMKYLGIILCILPGLVQGQTRENFLFDELNDDALWKLAFQDDGTDDWQSLWMLDGVRADIQNTPEGMIFSAGPVEGDDACHAVLWTKQLFTGDVKIEFDYTRTDTRKSQVNIIYIQASGAGSYPEDIMNWQQDRIIPSMSNYFDKMNSLHISYAAFNNSGEYVRARKYPRSPGQKFSTSTEIEPTYFDTGLFLPGRAYHMIIIKTAGHLFFQVKGEADTRLFTWDLSEHDLVSTGRIGLRHMYTRSARYKDFKIYAQK